MVYQNVEIDYESEDFIEIVFDLLRRASSCDKVVLDDLETLLVRVTREIRADEMEPSDLEIFIDLEDELSMILNDTGFRDEQVGPNATTCQRLLEIVYKRIVPFNENFEVVLALNPSLPDVIVEKLMKSTFAWEEDGTTQALARASRSPERLRKLSKSQENSTRYEVALNPLTPPEVLENLAKDVEISDSYWYCGNGLESFIQVAVVRNPNTPRSVIEGFLSDRYFFTEPQFVASHGWSLVSGETLKELRKLLADEARTRLGVSG